MLEVRILNGLHRGAICPLDDTRVTLGSSEDADVVLRDPDLAGVHAEMCLLGGAWWLLVSRGEQNGEGVQDARDEQNRRDARARLSSEDGLPDRRIKIEIGKAVSLGGVWLVVAEHADAWRLPPAGSVTTREQSGPSPSAAAPSRGARRFALPVLGLLMIWTQDSVSSLEEWGKSSASVAAVYAGAHGREQVRDRENATIAASVNGSRGIESGEVVPVPVSSDLQGEMATRLREKLRELELDGLVSMSSAAGGLALSGELTDEEMTRFKSMLDRFKRDYPIAVPIFDSVRRMPDVLPFRIVEASLGRNPSITLSDGQRLFVGDTYGGYRLEAVTQSRIVLAGKHRLTLAW